MGRGGDGSSVGCLRDGRTAGSAVRYRMLRWYLSISSKASSSAAWTCTASATTYLLALCSKQCLAHTSGSIYAWAVPGMLHKWVGYLITHRPALSAAYAKAS